MMNGMMGGNGMGWMMGGMATEWVLLVAVAVLAAFALVKYLRSK